MPNNPMPTDERLQGSGGAAPPSVQYGGQPGYAPLSYASLNMLRGLVGQPSGGFSSGGQPPMAMDPRVIQAQAAAQQQAARQAQAQLIDQLRQRQFAAQEAQRQQQEAVARQTALEAAQQQALSQVGNAGRPRYTSYPPIGGVGAP